MNKLVALAALAMIAVAPSAHAYPISPVYLWGLTGEADGIFLADVESVIRADGQPSGDLRDARSATVVTTETRGPSVARLAVKETWKGPRLATVDIPFNSGLICPSPPSFEKGETVAAFLRRAETGWQVVALSYGVRHLEPDDIAPLRDRVRAALALQTHGRVARAARVEWLVACCHHPSTRWDAMRELAPRVDWFDAAYDRAKRPDLGSSLSPDQRAGIAQAYIDSPPSVAEIPVAAFLLRREPSATLTRTLKRAVEDGLTDPSVRWALPEAMAAVAKRLGVADASSLFTELEYSVDTRDYPSLSEFQLAWDKAMAARRESAAWE